MWIKRAQYCKMSMYGFNPIPAKISAAFFACVCLVLVDTDKLILKVTGTQKSQENIRRTKLEDIATRYQVKSDCQILETRTLRFW